MKTQNTVRVRFAPSPTGYLHIGSLRAAFFNWLYARHNNGVYCLRIEDTDTERSEQRFFESILESFKWVNLTPDEPIVIQSERMAEHQAIIKRLCQEGKAYPCFCTTQEVADRVGVLHKDGDMLVQYDRTCRDKQFSAKDLEKPHAIRFKIPDTITEVVFDDMIRGCIAVSTDQLDDFIIARSDGRPIYNFVVVIDDAFMHITHVIRGEDHITNTPKQILLYQACGYNLPKFAHMPLILGPDGNRLSKRDAATSVDEYKEEGFLPHALLNYLARLGWAHGDQEIFSLEEMVSYFTVEAIGKKGSIFDLEKLRWVNSVYMQKMSAQDILCYIEKELNPTIKDMLCSWSTEHIYAAIDIYKERTHTLKELINALLLLHNGPQKWNIKELLAKQTKESLIETLLLSCQALESVADFSHDQVESVLKHVAQRLSISLAMVARPVRCAILGDPSGPGVFALLMLLGKVESINRIQQAIAFIKFE